MSTPSYALSKKGNTWWASGTLAGGRPFKFECGKSTREAAVAVADLKMAQKAASSNGSRARWAKFHKERADAKAAAAAAPAAPPVVPASSAPVVPASTPAPAAAPNRSHEVWARLKALGDATSSPPEPEDEPDPDEDDDEEDDTPIEADEIIPPGGKRDADKDEGEDDEEAEELISDAIATAVVSGTIKIANAPLKKKGRRGEPDDRFRDLEHKGVKRAVEKLVDGHMKLSPGMQILVGAVGTVLTVWINAEDIPGAQPQAAAAAPAAAAGTTNGHNSSAPAGNTAPTAAPTSTELSLSSQLGQFGTGAGVPTGSN